jgi:hypothetical protein
MNPLARQEAAAMRMTAADVKEIVRSVLLQCSVPFTAIDITPSPGGEAAPHTAETTSVRPGAPSLHPPFSQPRCAGARNLVRPPVRQTRLIW